MARMSGGKALVESLNVHGVETVFGVLGSTLLPAYDAFCDRSDIRLVAPRGEDGALHMADAYARVTGKPGVAMVTVGAGAVASRPHVRVLGGWHRDADGVQDLARFDLFVPDEPGQYR